MSTTTRDDKGRYKYVVLVASFMALLFNSSMDYVSGVIHVALLEEYHVEEDVAVWLGSLFFCMYGLGGPIASFIINMSDCRTCVFLSGIVGLVGFSINVFITDINWLFLTYALIAGAIVFHSSIAGLLMRPTKFERERKKHLFSGRTRQAGLMNALCGDCSGYAKMISNKSFLFFLFSAIGFGMGLSNIYLFLPDYLNHNGISHQDASFSVSLSGIGGTFSRVLSGFAASDDKIGSGLLYACINGLMGILCLIIPLFTSSVMASYAFGLLMGLYTGGTWTLFNPITHEILGLELIASGIGTLMFFCGLGSLLGPSLAVITYKAASSYYIAYVFTGLTFFFCTLCAFLSSTFRRPPTSRIPPTTTHTQEPEVQAMLEVKESS